MMRRLLSFLLLLGATSSCLAQGVYNCDTILTSALREYNIHSESSSNLNEIFSQYCYADGRTNSSSLDIGVDAVVKGIPAKFTLGSNDSSQAMTNFCKTYSSSSDLRSKSDSYQETIVRRAYDSYDACVRIASEGYFVTHSITARDRAQILLRAGVGKPIEVTGVDTTENISCYGPDGAGKKIEYNAWTGSKVMKISEYSAAEKAVTD